eukprot:gene11974-13211_t
MEARLIMSLFFVLFACLFLITGAAKYKDNENVPFYVNKVGPYYNPQETYHYYSLPVCRPEKVEHRSLTLGEVLDGDRMAVAQYQVKFKEDVKVKPLCKVQLKAKDVEILFHAIEDLYYYEFIIDDLPVRGFIGHLEESGFLPHKHKVFLWSHLIFRFEYNGDQIISVNVSTIGHDPVDLTNPSDTPLDVEFTYSVIWTKSNVPYSERLSRSEASEFFPKTLEMRVLKKDFSKYNVADEESTEFEQEDCGWKMINTDVFRFPTQRSLLCSILGNGSQFLTLCLGIITMALMGLFNVHRHGSMNTAAVLLYALTCFVSGYVSNSFYKQINGDKWAWNLVLTASLFTVPFFVIWSVINSVAWYHQSTQALPFTTIVLLILIWLLVGFPLTVLGGIFGKNWTSGFDAPCRTKNIPREIPTKPWYRNTFAHMLIGGFLPFSAISVELYYIFSTLWGREQYTLYGILLVVFLILLSVTASISVALTYFQLSAEDYRWWWRSVICAGSTGVFVFIYSIYFFLNRSNMFGFLQSLQFFGYMLLVCYIFALMLGTVGFFASLKFTKYIYRNIKMD